MIPYLNLLIGAAFACLYWILSLTLTVKAARQRVVLAFPKLLASMATHFHLPPLIPRAVMYTAILGALRSWTIVFYALGDVVLIWTEHHSLLFFGIGHVLFSAVMVARGMPTGLLAVCAIISAGLAKAGFRVWKTTSDSDSNDVSYALYIGSLATAVTLGVVQHAYGVLLFAVSDLLIAMQVTHSHYLTYPLYYLSLIYFCLFV